MEALKMDFSFEELEEKLNGEEMTVVEEIDKALFSPKISDIHFSPGRSVYL